MEMFTLEWPGGRYDLWPHVIFSDDDDVQSPPTRIVFRFHETRTSVSLGQEGKGILTYRNPRKGPLHNSLEPPMAGRFNLTAHHKMKIWSIPRWSCFLLSKNFISFKGGIARCFFCGGFTSATTVQQRQPPSPTTIITLPSSVGWRILDLIRKAQVHRNLRGWESHGAPWEGSTSPRFFP